MQDNTASNSTGASQLLKGIAVGKISGLNIPKNAIVSGNKIKNDILRIFVDTNRSSGMIDDKDLLDIIILFDSAVEKGLITNKLLEILEKDPDFISNYLKSKVNK